MEESVFSQSPFGTESSSSSSTSNGSSSTRGKKLIFLVILLVILGLIAFFAVKFLGGESKEATPTPTPTEVVTPTDTPSPTPTILGSPTPSPKTKVSPTSAKTTVTPSPTKGATGSSVDSATGLDREKLSVIVQNGSGLTGAGKTMGDKLTALGYNVTSVGNADTSDYAQTEIHVKTTDSSYIALLKKDLGADYTIGTSASDYTGSGNALIIVGKQ